MSREKQPISTEMCNFDSRNTCSICGLNIMSDGDCFHFPGMIYPIRSQSLGMVERIIEVLDRQIMNSLSKVQKRKKRCQIA